MHPLEIRNLVKQFEAVKNTDEVITILSGISLIVPQASSVSIIGKSGTGKSTLLQIAGGLDKPTSGQIICDGTDITSLNDLKASQFRNKKIGFIFQANLLLDDFTALENVMIPALIDGKNNNSVRDRACSLLCDLGLEDRLDYLPGKLSGGEKQRVAICRALVNEPEIILADEPTGSLDEENAQEVEDLLLSLVKRESRSMLLVTHNNDFADKCDYTYLLKNHNLISLRESI